MVCDTCKEQMLGWNIPVVDENAVMIEYGADAPDHDCDNREECKCGCNIPISELSGHEGERPGDDHRYDPIEGIYPPSIS